MPVRPMSRLLPKTDIDRSVDRLSDSQTCRVHDLSQKRLRQWCGSARRPSSCREIVCCSTIAARFAEIALRNRLPAASLQREYAEAGFLLTYGADIQDLYRRSTVFVDKIFKGAKPADLPIEQPTKFELVINLETANALGVEVPTSLLQRADDVIE